MAQKAILVSDRPKSTSADGAVPFRQAPHNLEAEQALLGAILVNNEAIDRVSSFLEPHHFFDPLHQQIFETAAKLIHAGKNATPITLQDVLRAGRADRSRNLTVPQYLGTLAANATTIINAEDYGRTVYDLATRRALIIIGEDMVNGRLRQPRRLHAADADRGSGDAALRSRRAAQVRPGLPGLRSARSPTPSTWRTPRSSASGHLSGLATGLTDLDNKLGGLQPSDLIILAGRPSMGKTALATNIAYNIAKRIRLERQTDGSDKTVDGAIVGFFSLEMSAEQLATRILSEQTEVSSEKIRRGMINEDEFAQAGTRLADDEPHSALHRPDRRHLDRPARRARAQAEAPEGPRAARRRLPAAPDRPQALER